jgi:threonyl-tRNA synthetase
VLAVLKAAGLRAELDESSERMNYKIRAAQVLKIPYMLVIGDREMEAHEVAVRLRTEQNLGAMPLDAFIARTRQLIASHNNTEL